MPRMHMTDDQRTPYGFVYALSRRGSYAVSIFSFLLLLLGGRVFDQDQGCSQLVNFQTIDR